MKPKDKMVEQLPQNARDYIALVIRKMGYRRKIRLDVQQELEAHFADALQSITDENEKIQAAQTLIAEFGDPKLLATLLRRGKKRCRPLWAKSLIRFAQTISVCFVLFILYSVWFLSGKPSLTTDYLARWNQMVHPTVPDQNNAMPLYENAVKLYVEPEESIAEMVSDMNKSALSNSSTLSAEDQAKILDWLQKNKPAWREYVAASQKPYCWSNYHFEPNSAPEDQWLIGVILPHLGELRNLSKMGIWQARLKMNSGNPDAAFEDCLAVVRTGRHWQGKFPTLIEQLVGLAISKLGHVVIIQLADHPAVTSQMLCSIQNQLSELYQPEYPWFSLEGEKIWFLDTVQHSFTKGGFGGGHLLPNYAKHLWNTSGEDIDFIALCFVHARREETEDKAIELYDWGQKIIQRSPYQKKTENFSFNDYLNHIPRYRYMLIRTMMPAVDQAGDLAFRGKAEHDAARTILALKRWKLDKCDYPQRLSELVQGGYLDKEPPDPYTADSLRYEKRGDDFLLYSLGADFDDDGGVQTQDDPWGAKDQGGDRVFWPVP